MRTSFFPPLWSRSLIIVVLIIGIFFRFVNIDKKVFWHDEAFTALRISGYDSSQAKSQIFTGKVINIAILQKFQKINPEKNIKDTIKTLATEDPQHPPLYYGLLRIWVQLFGDSIVSLRIPSIIISLFVFPLAYWLCWELFFSPIIASLAVAFFAISPFQVLYAQEAREYSLCIVMILLINLTFLLAKRCNNISSWAIYSLSLTASYYTLIFAIPIAIGHGIYTLIQEKFKPSRITINHIIAGLISVVLFAPWLWTIIKNKNALDQGMDWAAKGSVSWERTWQAWGLHISTNFVDTAIGLMDFSNIIFPVIFTLFLIYTLYVLVKNSEPRVWLLLSILFLVPILFLMVPDIFKGGIRSLTSRYFTSWYAVIPIIFAYLIVYQINQNQFIKQYIWRGVYVSIISLGIISCTISSQSDYWWNKTRLGISIFEGAKVINQTVKPLIIADQTNNNFGDMLSMSHIVNQQTKFQIISDSDPPTVPTGFSNIFLYNLSPTLMKKFQLKYSAEALQTFDKTTLLELKPPLSGGRN